MSHRRTEIREGFRSFLAGKIPSIPSVKSVRHRMIEREELPFINITANEEDVDILNASPKIYRRTLEIGIEIYVQHKTDVDTACEVIMKQIESLIDREDLFTLHGTVSDIVLLGSSISPDGREAVLESAVGLLRYGVTYQTRAAKDPSLENPFDGVNVDWAKKAIDLVDVTPTPATARDPYWPGFPNTDVPDDGIGPPGPMGPVGLMGPIGPMGPVGSKGPKGDTGDTGVSGLQGLKGLSGDAGGTVGPMGPAGPKGPRGDEGDAGLIGPSGAKGEIGDTGLGGPIGPAGLKGPIGIVGPEGLTGAGGPKGETGPQGIIGESGLGGAKGPVGDTGLQGSAMTTLRTVATKTIENVTGTPTVTIMQEKRGNLVTIDVMWRSGLTKNGNTGPIAIPIDPEFLPVSGTRSFYGTRISQGADAVGLYRILASTGKLEAYIDPAATGFAANSSSNGWYDNSFTYLID